VCESMGNYQGLTCFSMAGLPPCGLPHGTHSLTLFLTHAIVGGPETGPARGEPSHEMPPVSAEDSLGGGLLPRVWGEGGAVWSSRGTANLGTQNTARDWYR
jgi:hypothetical protein